MNRTDAASPAETDHRTRRRRRPGGWGRPAGGTGAAEVLVVVGAGGGVGASTLAALLAAYRARDGGPVALVDLDHGRGGIEVLLGLEDEPGARWADLAGVRGGLAPADLDDVLPRWRGVEVLGPDRRGGAPDPIAVGATAVALVARCSTVVVDLPAHALLTDLGGSPGCAGPLLAERTDLLLLAGQDVLGVAGALALRGALDDGPAQLVLRRRRRARIAPLEAAHVVDLPLLGLLPTDRRLADATERGLGPVVGRRAPLARAVARTARGCGDG